MTKIAAHMPLLQEQGMQRKNDWMRLLTAQVRFQNPLDPKADPSAMLTQLAQLEATDRLSSIEHYMNKAQKETERFSSMQASVALIGKNIDVSAEGPVAVDANGLLSGRVIIPQAAQNMTVSIKNADNSLVQEVSLGPHAAGDRSFSLALPPGIYRVSARADVGAGMERACPVHVRTQMEKKYEF